MCHKINLKFILIFTILSIPAKAEIPDTSLNFIIGAGVIYSPAFYGSEDYQILLAPFLAIEYKDRVFLSIDGFRYNLINCYGWRIGPAAKYDFGRKENNDINFNISGEEQTALNGLDEVQGAIKVGAFAEYSYKPFKGKINLYKGINEHEDFIGKVDLHYSGFIPLFGIPIIYEFGPHTTFAGSDYINAYYGIDETQSANSGLNQYHTDSGFISYGIDTFVMHPITQSISLTFLGGYDHLSKKISDSPVIKQYGNRNQFTCGIMINYRFGY